MLSRAAQQTCASTRVGIWPHGGDQAMICQRRSLRACTAGTSVAHVTQVIKEAIYDAFYKLTDSRSQITAYVFDVVRASVPRMDLDEIFVVRAVLHSWSA